MSPRRFVNRRIKFRGDLEVRTNLQSGQTIVTEDGERPIRRVFFSVSENCFPMLNLSCKAVITEPSGRSNDNLDNEK